MRITVESFEPRRGLARCMAYKEWMIMHCIERQTRQKHARHIPAYDDSPAAASFCLAVFKALAIAAITAGLSRR